MNFYELVTSLKADTLKQNDILYHYTSLDTFCTMLADDADFYCTHFNALNDAAEVLMGELVIEKFLKRNFGWTEDKCMWFRVNYRNMIKNEECVVPWIMSFSRARDCNNQWIAYTDKLRGGVSIGFDRVRILGEIDRKPGCYHGCVSGECKEKSAEPSFCLRLVPCLYEGTDDQAVDKMLNDVFNPFKELFERIGFARSDQEIDRKDFVCAVNVILELSTVIKHRAFEYEQEERLVLLPMTRSCEDCVMIGGKPRWKTHIAETTHEGLGSSKLRGIRGMMKEVLISPHGDRELAMTSVKVLLNKYNMDFCNVHESRSPYNGR